MDKNKIEMRYVASLCKQNNNNDLNEEVLNRQFNVTFCVI